MVIQLTIQRVACTQHLLAANNFAFSLDIFNSILNNLPSIPFLILWIIWCLLKKSEITPEQSQPLMNLEKQKQIDLLYKKMKNINLKFL